jgi:hypothetical protein
VNAGKKNIYAYRVLSVVVNGKDAAGPSWPAFLTIVHDPGMGKPERLSPLLDLAGDRIQGRRLFQLELEVTPILRGSFTYS